MPKLKRIEVTEGVFWVEAAEADLRILCGCPADSVKHMIQRGLIAPTEVAGVSCETGPNAILLSDVMLQNGYFSNLGEFPVMQMLYKQGMLLPNHPNNTGVKPLLIGTRKQIQAQMEYIYRGNYGLISEDEIEAAGAAPGMDARDLMRMKLQFAFGRITRTEELLDALVLEEGPAEIRNGVFVRRRGVNVFEFSFAGETVEVDLNLSPNSNYRSPYPLCFHDIRREYFAVVHSGQGDGWDFNRPAMSSILLFQGKVYLVDAGPNVAYTLIALGIGVNEIHGIFQTHAHDDHVSGLTTLIRADHRIKFYATPLVRATVVKKMSALLSIEEERFTDFFETHDLAFDIWNNVEGLEVRPVLSPHPLETSIFTFRAFWEGEHLSYGHFADIVSRDVLEGMIREPEAEMGVSRAFFDRVMAEYATPLTVKKIDIGGGMVHGNVEDFREDTSERIILAHTAAPLTNRQKRIGSSAPFGVADVLVADTTNTLQRIASRFLEAYFPSVPEHDLQTLLNNQVVTFQPGSIVFGEGETNADVFLVLTGIAERFQSGQDAGFLLSSGEIIGEHSGLHQFPSPATYRTVSFVKALRIPHRLYLDFVKRNKLFTKIERLHEHREFLQRTPLFGEAIAYPTQNRIAGQMTLRHFYHAGDEMPDLNPDALFLVQSGRLERIFTEDGKTQELGPGSFFGGEAALFKDPVVFAYRTLEPAGIYEVPIDTLRDVPIVLWKLFETYGKTMQLMEHPA